MFNNKKFKKELARKFFHLLMLPGAAIFIYVESAYSSRTALLITTAILILVLKIEYLRLEYEINLVPRFLRFFMRKKEEFHYNGVVYFILAMIICFAIFDRTIALVSLLFAAFGDFASAIFGMAFGKKKFIKNKTYVGFYSGVVANFIVGAVFLLAYPPILIPMVLTASFVEVFTHKLDDNLTVPLFAGFVGQMIAMAFDITL